MCWRSYLDDFVCFNRASDTATASFCAETLFKMLGWALAKDKEQCFDFACKALGLMLDLASARLGYITLDNSQKRKSELGAAVNSALFCGKLSKPDAQRLLGCLLFAESQVFGRRSTKAMGALSSFKSAGPSE